MSEKKVDITFSLDRAKSVFVAPETSASVAKVTLPL